MATKIRLARGGKKRKPIYSVVVADSRSPRDGKFIEKLGIYNPNVEPPLIDINVDSAFAWVMKGAEITDTAKKLLSLKGIMLKKHLQVGVNKGAITQEVADEKFAAWEAEKAKATDKTVADKAKAKEDAVKKSAEERAQIRKDAADAEKKATEDALAAAAAAEAPAEEVESTESTEDAPAAEATEEVEATAEESSEEKSAE